MSGDDGWQHPATRLFQPPRDGYENHVEELAALLQNSAGRSNPAVVAAIRQEIISGPEGTLSTMKPGTIHIEMSTLPAEDKAVPPAGCPPTTMSAGVRTFSAAR